MNIAFATVCTEGYYEFFRRFLLSLLKHNPEFDLPFYVFYRDLPELYSNNLKSIYKNLKFIDVDYSVYDSRGKGNFRFYSNEIFNIDCDRVIYIDSDMICLQPIDELIEIAKGVEGIAMAKEIRRCNSMPYNAGLIIVGKKYLNEETYNSIFQSDYTNIKGHLNDQKTYNLFFKDRIEEISIKFNTLVSEVDFIQNDEIIFLHYIYKPNTPRGKEALSEWQVKEYDKYKEDTNES